MVQKEMNKRGGASMPRRAALFGIHTLPLSRPKFSRFWARPAGVVEINPLLQGCDDAGTCLLCNKKGVPLPAQGQIRRGCKYGASIGARSSSERILSCHLSRGHDEARRKTTPRDNINPPDIVWAGEASSSAPRR